MGRIPYREGRSVQGTGRMLAEIPPKERVSGIYGISQLFDTEKISFVSTHPHSTYIGKRGDFCVETKENSMQTKELSLIHI